MREDPIHEGTHIYPIYCIFTSPVCTTLWVGKLIGITEECVYGVIGVYMSGSMHVFGWSFKTYFGLQWGVKLNKKISNLIF